MRVTLGITILLALAQTASLDKMLLTEYDERTCKGYSKPIGEVRKRARVFDSRSDIWKKGILEWYAKSAPQYDP